METECDVLNNENNRIKVYHEAGFDALITGYVYLKLLVENQMIQ